MTDRHADQGKRILCTMPGRHGDILWSLPTVRAISEREGVKVSLALSAKYGSLKPLLARQPYIAEVRVLGAWGLAETAPITPRTPPTLDADHDERDFDQVVHLGYEGWPSAPLPVDIAQRAGVEIDLARPWITPTFSIPRHDICAGFTDEWFELKVGLYWLLFERFVQRARPLVQLVSLSNSPRWNREKGTPELRWEGAAAYLATTRLFVGCCSALHVLAVAVGAPAVIVEPAAARLQEVFWPLGFDGPQVRVVRGGDGLPTFDARHTGDLIDQILTDQRKEAGRAVAQ